MNLEEKTESCARGVVISQLALLLEGYLPGICEIEGKREFYVFVYGKIFGVAVEFQNEHKVLKNYTDARLRTIIKRALRNAKGHALLVCFQHFKIDNCSTWIRK